MPEMGFCVRWEMLTRLTLYPARQRAGSALQPAGPGLSGKSNRSVARLVMKMENVLFRVWGGIQWSRK